MQDLLTIIAKGLVDDPDAVSVSQDEPAEDGTVVYHIHVAEDDMGRIIGKQGRIAKALRTILSATATKSGKHASLEILD